MDLSRKLSDLISYHPRRLVAASVVAVFCAAVVLLTKLSLDSEILNLLPDHYDSIEGLKIVNEEFRQGRELTIAIIDDDPNLVDEFTDHVASMLEEEDWVMRFIAEPPMESVENLEDLHQLAVPLLLNLPSERFVAVMESLEPIAVRDRLQTLLAEIQAGSPVAEFQITADPLGIVAPAMEPLQGAGGLSLGDPLATEDGTMRIILITTTQESLDAWESQQLMENVNAFRDRALTTWGANALPEMHITGRAAFVAEISSGMRDDMRLTIVTSLILVSLVFYFAYRRLSLLLAICIIIIICCVFTLAFASLVFGQLNAITIGFFAILLGLGIDFALLLYSKFSFARQQNLSHSDAITSAIQHAGPGIFFGAITTASAFLVILFSESRGFGQLGVLIATGILLCGILMPLLLFLFVRKKNSRRLHTKSPFTSGYLTSTSQHPYRWAGPAIILVAVLAVIALLPSDHTLFNANPRSLDPKDSAASIAYQKIVEKLPYESEPVMAFQRVKNPDSSVEQWQDLQSKWKTLVENGDISGFSLPTGIILQSQNFESNLSYLQEVDFKELKSDLQSIIANSQFSTAPFNGTLKIIEQLETRQNSPRNSYDWNQFLPPSSPWWYLLDRYLSLDQKTVAGYIHPAESIDTLAQKTAFEAQLQLGDSGILLSGWKFTLAELIPWARKELVMLSSIMIVLITVLLAVAYRKWSLWFFHLLSLVSAVAGLIATLKIFHIELNLLNVLAFPLVLGVGVDYGIHTLLAFKSKKATIDELATVVKPLTVCALTTIAGFGSLGLANNPSLSGLGIVCAIGVFWCIACNLVITIPLATLYQHHGQMN